MKSLLALIAVFFAFGCSRPSLPEGTLASYQSGAKKRLSEFHGKPMVVDFWATWCGPCRETLPHLQELYDKYAQKGLEVVAVTTDSTDEISHFLASTHYTFPIYLDKELEVSKTFGVDAIPVSIVVDKEGGIVWRGHPGDQDQLDRAIESALN